MILAGDVGGTKTVLALYGAADFGKGPIHERTFVSRQHDSLESIVGEFLADTPKCLDAACFGVAGPVVEGRCQTTNLPWLIEKDQLAALFNIANVQLINDMVAMAIGMLHLPERERIALNLKAGPRAFGNIAVIAAGTGLGEAILYGDHDDTYRAMASEGGHCDFAPNNPAESRLLAFLRNEYQGHVSYERIVSGPGLLKIYQYLVQSGLGDPAVEAGAIEASDNPSAMISRLGLTDKDPVCAEALAMFIRIFGAEAGNLALKCGALGGVHIGGGIAPKLLPVLKSGTFMEGFVDKGRLRGWLEKIPVNVALNPGVALIGALHQALDLLAPIETEQ